MPTNIDELQIEINTKAADASKGVTGLTTRLKNLSKAINGINTTQLNSVASGIGAIGTNSSNTSIGLTKTAKSANKATKSFNGLVSAFGKFYATYFLLVRGAKGVWDNIQSAMDYVETYNYFAVSLGKIGSQFGEQFEQFGYESAEAYIDSFETRLNELNKKLSGYTLGESGELLIGGDIGLGMDIEQMMNFQAKTLAVTNSVGLLGETSINTTKAISMLAGDLSSLTNMNIESVMTNLSSGLIGQSRALYKYGIDITNNTLQQYALAEGIEKSVAEMTQSEKMQLRLLAILDQSKVAWGDLGNTVNSVANQYRISQQQIGNLGRTIGNLFLPIVKNVLPYVNGLIIALNELFTTIGFDIYGDTWLEDLQGDISGGAQEGLEDMEDAADDTTDAMNKLKKSVRAFDELNVISISTASSSSGLMGELEGTVDLTQSISDAVADYEKAWDAAFTKAENKASEFAKTLKDDFQDAREVIEAITPVLVGTGTAMFTYKIASGIGTLITSLGVLGTPAGIAALAAGAVGGFAFAFAELNKELKEKDLEGRFGDITLSLEEIETVAKEIVNNKNLEGVSTLLAEMSELSGIESSIKGHVDTLNRLNWKVSVGLELTEEEQGQYKSAIDGYIADINDYVTQQQYAANIGIKLFLSDSETSESIQTTVNTFYANNQQQLAQLGKDLNKAVTDAWNDGLLTIDEVSTISEIQRQMAEIQSELSTSEFQARMQLLQAEYSGSKLTPETYKKLQEERQKLLDQYEADLNESLVFTIANITLAYEAEIEAGTKTQADLDKAISEVIQSKNNQLSEMVLNSFTFDLNTLEDTYGNEMRQALDGINNDLIVYAKKFTENKDWAEQGVAELMNATRNAFKKQAGKTGQENLADLMNSMSPTTEFEELAQSYYEETGQIPESIANALVSKYSLDTINGSLDSIYKLMLVTSNAEDRDAVISQMEELGIDVPTFLSKGLDDNAFLATKSAENMIGDIQEIASSQVLRNEFYNLGKELGTELSNGFTDIALPQLNLEFPKTDNLVDTFAHFSSIGASSKIDSFNSYNQLSTLLNKLVEQGNSQQLAPEIRVYVGDRELTDIAIDGINERTRLNQKSPLLLK